MAIFGRRNPFYSNTHWASAFTSKIFRITTELQQNHPESSENHPEQNHPEPYLFTQFLFLLHTNRQFLHTNQISPRQRIRTSLTQSLCFLRTNHHLPDTNSFPPFPLPPTPNSHLAHALLIFLHNNGTILNYAKT